MHDPAERILTQRLIIRRFTPQDADAIFESLSDPQTVFFEPYGPITRKGAEKEAIRRSESDEFFAVCLADGTYVGNIYLGRCEFDTFELGYVFSRQYWGRGYACEAALAMLRFAFESLEAHRVTACCARANERSWRLLDRIGMRREGLMLENVYFKTNPDGTPIWFDSYCYALLKSEWENAFKK